MFWTGGGVEIEPSQSVLRVLQRLVDVFDALCR